MTGLLHAVSDPARGEPCMASRLLRLILRYGDTLRRFAAGACVEVRAGRSRKAGCRKRDMKADLLTVSVVVLGKVG